MADETDRDQWGPMPKQVVILALTLLGFGAVAHHVFTEPGTRGNEVLHFVVVLIGIFLVSERIASTFTEWSSHQEARKARAYFEEKFKEWSDNIIRSSASTQEIFVFPTNLEALEYMRGSIGRAIAVDNAVLRYGDENPGGPYGKKYGAWMKAKSTSITSGAQWREIISKFVKFNEEQDKIFQSFKEGAFYKSIVIDDRDHPIIQMTSIVYRDGQKEVLFGFHFPGRLTGPVFLTRNRQLCAFFDHYFEFNFSRLSRQNSRPESSEVASRPVGDRNRAASGSETNVGSDRAAQAAAHPDSP